MAAGELTEAEKMTAVLQIFYPDFDNLTDYGEAYRQCVAFINGGEEEPQTRIKRPLLVSWGQDIGYIIAPINRVIGREIRAIKYSIENNKGGLHWYTFLSAYKEIGNCLFAQIVGVRNKKAHCKKLEKYEQDFYRENRDIVDIRTRYTEAEDELFQQWNSE